MLSAIINDLLMVNDHIIDNPPEQICSFEELKKLEEDILKDVFGHKNTSSVDQLISEEND